jgi:type IX secretion system PorP/SprF family membrane protein
MAFSYELKAQQDVQFTQYIFDGLALNPGYAGYKEVTNAHLLYRDQWTGLDGSPKTITATVDGVTENKQVGLGFQVIDDKLGAESNLSAFASYAYRVQVGQDARLSFGLAAGLIQYNVDGTKLSLLNPDANFSNIKANVINPDLNFGLFYASNHYFWGLSVTNLLSNLQYNSSTYLYLYRVRHYYAQAGAIFDLGENISIKPSILLKEDFKGPTNVDINLFLLLGRQFWIGGSYRTGVKMFSGSNLESNLSGTDAVSGIVEFDIDQHLRLGYSYDFTTSHLSSVSGGTHEVSLSYRFSKKSSLMLTPRNL